MEFIEQNIVWIIVVAVIFLMTIIGYVADKTDFGKNKAEKPVKVKEKKEKKVKEKKAKKGKDKKEEIENVEPISEPGIDVNTLPKDDIDPINDFPLENNTEESTEQAFDTDEMDLNPNMDNFMVSDNSDESLPTKNNDTVETVEPLESVLPVENVETTDSVEPTTVSEDNFNMPFEMPEETKPEENISTDSSDEELNVENNSEVVSDELLGNQKDDLEIELPSIDTLDKELEDNSEDDDVWKF